MGGIEQSERCFYVAGDNKIAVIREVLGSQGIAVDSALEAGVSLLDEKSEPFIGRIRFDVDTLFTYLDNRCVEAGIRGHGPIRLAREMTWAANDKSTFEKFIAFEQELDTKSMPRLRMMCQFNLNLLEPQAINDAVRVHREVIFNGRSSSQSYSPN
jgi:hypothetical protein